MIAGKTHSEILSLTDMQRYRWRKTILPKEREEAMKMMENIRRAKISANNPMKRPEVRAKISASLTGKTPSKATRALISASLTGKTHSEETKAKMSATRMGHSVSEETRAKLSVAWTGVNNPMYGRTGENSGNWQGGVSFEPYGIEFNDELKRQIRNRDNHTCQECHRMEEQLYCALDVHHIDYNKKNNSPENLISLCRSCHIKTNFSREDWIEYFGGSFR